MAFFAMIRRFSIAKKIKRRKEDIEGPGLE